MAFQLFYGGVLNELISACQIRYGGNEQLLCVQLSSNDLPTLRFLSVATESEEPTLCKLVFSSGSQRAVQDCTPGTRWVSPYHPVVVKVIGQGFEVEHQHLQNYWPLMLYDICNFIAKCCKGGMEELLIECDARTAQLLLCAQVPTEANGLTVKAFAASFFTFTCLVRLTGIRQMQVALQTDSLYIARMMPCGSGEMRVCIFRPDDAEFVEKFQSCLTSNTSDVIICILFNELELCEWYLRVKGVEGQRHRLPSHDATRLQMMSHATRLTVQVTAFDFQQDNCYRTTGELTADETLAEFKDDEILQAVIPVCRQTAQQRSFHLECFTVPCRTTLHLMTLLTELDKKNCLGLHVDTSKGNEAYSKGFSDTSGDPDGILPMLEASPALVHSYQDLTNKSASVPVTNSQRRSFLHCAVLAANPALVKQLLETKAVDVNCTDEDSATPLLLAVVQEDLQITRLLLECGADCSVRDSKGRTAVTVALTSGSSDIVEVLTDHSPGLMTDDEEFASSYSLALKAGHKDVCVLLIARKYGFAEDCINEAVKLSCLVCLGKYEALHDRLTAQNCNYRDWKLRTPLMWASIGNQKPSENHSKCADLLLHLGADLAARDLEGNTPLHLAAAKGNAQVARSLLHFGASASVKNFQGATPEMMAKELGHEEVLNVFTDEADECFAGEMARLQELMNQQVTFLQASPSWLEGEDVKGQLAAIRSTAERVLETMAQIKSQKDQRIKFQGSSMEVSEGQPTASVMSNNIDGMLLFNYTIDLKKIVELDSELGFDSKNISDYTSLDFSQLSAGNEKICYREHFISSVASYTAADEFQKAYIPHKYRRQLASKRCCTEFEFQNSCSAELPRTMATN